MTKLAVVTYSSLLVFGGQRLGAQVPSGAGTLQGVVVDASGAAIPLATVTLAGARRGLRQSSRVDSSGAFRFERVEFGDWQLTVAASGFEPHASVLSIRAAAAPEVRISLAVAGLSASMDVSDRAPGQIELSPTARGSLSHSAIDQLPVQNQATGLSEMITRTTAGVASDGNGFAHPLGEHADTSISIDDQPITDQQAKIFSNQLSTSIVESMEVITGAPPAEFGDKTSLIINVTTQSGLGKRRPFGTFSSQYGSFGSWSEGLTYGLGSARWGNFAAVTASGSGRFLDSPEFRPIHDRGNAESVFDRLDWQPSGSDSVHVNFSAARSWFQTPNTFDSDAGQQDQRSQIRSFSIAAGWTHLLNPNMSLSVHPFVRFDRSQYFPSRDVLADRPATLSQSRYLTNAGFRSDLAWTRGRHSAKAGGSYWHTLLRERFNLGITDPAWNAPGPDFNPNLVPYDLTRGGGLYSFRGDADVQESALYVQDSARLGRLSLNSGLRYDRYNGLSRGHQLQPRLGVAYRAPWTGTMIRLSYARLFETPYNENLIIASQATVNPAAANPFGKFRSSPPRPGMRNQFNAGMAQALGPHLALDADYFWKFTKNAFDFDSLFLTPVTFPIGWRKSKIDGLAARVTLTNLHGFSAYTVMGHTRSRFFGPENGGLVFTDVPDSSVFRIDHSEEFEQTTFARYQHGKAGPWLSFTWRFNSGLALPGVVPTFADALQLTGDEQAQMGLYCGGTYATRMSPIRSCSSAVYGALRISIPAPGTHNDDLHPTRVSPRNVFDAGMGTDDLLHGERYKVRLALTVLNVTNRIALYNFLSTFSGTHFVTPRVFQVEMKLMF